MDAQVFQVTRQLCNVEGQEFEALELFSFVVENGDAGEAAVEGAHSGAVLKRDDKVHPPQWVSLIAGSICQLQRFLACIKRSAEPIEQRVNLAVCWLEWAEGGGHRMSSVY